MNNDAINMAISQLREFDKTLGYLRTYQKNEIALNVMLMDLVELCEYDNMEVPQHIADQVNKFKQSIKPETDD